MSKWFESTVGYRDENGNVAIFKTDTVYDYEVIKNSILDDCPKANPILVVYNRPPKKKNTK